MARKTSKEYSKEHQDLTNKLKALETRIEKRTLDLCQQFPDVIIGEITTAKDFKHWYDDINILDTNRCLKVMSKIEEYNEKQSGHIQTTIFPK